MWTVGIKKSYMHDFYIKMLYYYDLMGFIVWLPFLSPDDQLNYQKYVSDKLPITTISKNIYSIYSSLSKEKKNEILNESQSKYFETVKIMSSIEDKKNNNKNTVKIKASMLPVGHLYNKKPFIYDLKSEKFITYINFIKSPNNYVENDIIIGYYEKKSIGMNISFKLRNPVQNMLKNVDARLKEKGSSCTSKTKKELLDICKKLNIEIKDNLNIPNICNLIESKLINKELEEKKKKSNIKWLYLFWEYNPI